METVRGCEHYKRNCLVESPCCHIFYPCKLCHDEKYFFKKGCQIERMAFAQVPRVKCLVCELAQQPAEKCANCGIIFSRYVCLKCRLYEDDQKKSKDIFHCQQGCQLCRRGKRQDFMHCDKCNYCVAIDTNHKCIEQISESCCPICLEIIKYSRKSFYPLQCGHLIHNECARQYSGLNCPTCGMAMVKLSKRDNDLIAQQINLTKSNLPPQLLDKKVDILCNECLAKTFQAQFHYFGIRCGECGTFNTKMI